MKNRLDSSDMTAKLLTLTDPGTVEAVPEAAVGPGMEDSFKRIDRNAATLRSARGWRRRPGPAW
jgi:hypothetical protein